MQPAGVVENAKGVNHLKDLQKYGQSVWLDYIRRNLITSGDLQRLIDDDGLRGDYVEPVDLREKPLPIAMTTTIF